MRGEEKVGQRTKEKKRRRKKTEKLFFSPRHRRARRGLQGAPCNDEAEPGGEAPDGDERENRPEEPIEEREARGGCRRGGGSSLHFCCFLSKREREEKMKIMKRKFLFFF